MTQKLLNRYSVASNNDRKFVGAKILDEIAEKELTNNERTVQRLVSETIDEATLENDNLERKRALALQRSHQIAVAADVSSTSLQEKP